MVESSKTGQDNGADILEPILNQIQTVLSKN